MHCWVCGICTCLPRFIKADTQRPSIAAVAWRRVAFEFSYHCLLLTAMHCWVCGICTCLPRFIKADTQRPSIPAVAGVAFALWRLNCQLWTGMHCSAFGFFIEFLFLSFYFFSLTSYLYFSQLVHSCLCRLYLLSFL